MRREPLHPLRFGPILKELIWGGRRLGTILNKPLGSGSRYAESWEVADHRDDVSIVKDGPHAVHWTHAEEVNSALLEFLR